MYFKPLFILLSSNYNEIFNTVKEKHRQDAVRCTKLVKSSDCDKHEKESISIPSYDVILPNKIVKSTSPILSSAECSLIRESSETYWANAGKSTSRFTYQRVGNSELHVEDLDEKALDVVNSALKYKLYPWIQELFNLDKDIVLSVYDSLVIRYNATEANADGLIGAGQPLHRDLGMYSVNIALNDRNAGDFEGGGTFFEELISLSSNGGVFNSLPTLHTDGLGYGLAHLSSTRHAGSGTYKGVRDIIVFFITALPLLPVEFAMRCKGLSTDTQLRIPHTTKEDYYRASLAKNDNDSESWQFLAMSLLEKSTRNKDLSKKVLDLIISFLDKAESLSPSDPRIHNNFSLVLQKRLAFLTDEDSKISEQMRVEYHYRRALTLVQACSEAGCEIKNDECSVRLNYGLWLSYQDRFEEAYSILNAPCLLDVKSGHDNERMLSLTRIQEDAQSLKSFCKKKYEMGR